MRTQHPSFAEQADASATVWRYFNFPKFVSMLETRSLYFSRADLLGDPFEGSYTRAYEVARQHMLDEPPEGMTRELLETGFQSMESWSRTIPKQVYVNCWHLGDHESMAMWRGYGDGPYGIAIRSTYGLLDAALPERFDVAGRAEPIYLCRVRYLDYSSIADDIPQGNPFVSSADGNPLRNLFAPFACKSVVYRHESEVRAVLADLHGEQKDGYDVPVDMSPLIQQITVSPLAPGWFEEVVRGVCKQFGFEFHFEPSVAATTPIF